MTGHQKDNLFVLTMFHGQASRAIFGHKICLFYTKTPPSPPFGLRITRLIAIMTIVWYRMVLHCMPWYFTVLHSFPSGQLALARGLYLARHLSTLYQHYKQNPNKITSFIPIKWTKSSSSLSGDPLKRAQADMIHETAQASSSSSYSYSPTHYHHSKSHPTSKLQELAKVNPIVNMFRRVKSILHI